MTRKKQGFDFAIGVTRFFMRTHGIWPGCTESKVGIVRYSYVPAALMIFCFINGPQTVQVFRVSGDLNAILDILTLANVPIGIALVKLLNVSYNQDVLRQLIVSLSEDWNQTTKESELNVMWEKAKTSRAFSIICVILGEGTVIAYTARMTYVLYAHKSLQALEGEEISRPLYMAGKFPYDTQSSPSYEITFTLQFIATTLSAGAFSSVDALFFTLVFHLCGQLINLQTAFKKIGEAKNVKESEFVRSLTVLVEKHCKINEFADIIECSFNAMFLFQVLSSTVLLCLQGYLFVLLLSGGKIILVEMVFMLYFTICFTFSIFVYCYVAELLREESLQLRNAIFYSKWYNLPAKDGRLLIMSMLRVKKPLEITAGKYGVLSLNLFCNIAKKSAGYMSVLLAVKDNLM